MGSIPKEIGILNNLTELNLGTNQLTGPIPSEIGDMIKIIKMYYARAFCDQIYAVVCIPSVS
jgi:hypothetical protein